MKIHYFQHSPSEGLGEIAEWARRKGHSVTSTHFYRGERPPPLDDLDWLILMGGPMNIYEHRNHPWLVEEKQFLARSIAKGKTVLGICLGAQLIADTLGGKVFQNPEIEIGWFPVRFDPNATNPSPGGKAISAFAGIAADLIPLHWHGDTFSLPPGAVNVAESNGCRHQAFAAGERVVGLQFHLEVGPADVAAFLEGEPEDLGKGRFIQTKAEILAEATAHLPKAHAALESMLDALEAATPR